MYFYSISKIGLQAPNGGNIWIFHKRYPSFRVGARTRAHPKTRTSTQKMFENQSKKPILLEFRMLK